MCFNVNVAERWIGHTYIASHTYTHTIICMLVYFCSYNDGDRRTTRGFDYIRDPDQNPILCTRTTRRWTLWWGLASDNDPNYPRLGLRVSVREHHSCRRHQSSTTSIGSFPWSSRLSLNKKKNIFHRWIEGSIDIRTTMIILCHHFQWVFRVCNIFVYLGKLSVQLMSSDSEQVHINSPIKEDPPPLNTLPRLCLPSDSDSSSSSDDSDDSDETEDERKFSKSDKSGIMLSQRVTTLQGTGKSHVFDVQSDSSIDSGDETHIEDTQGSQSTNPPRDQLTCRLRGFSNLLPAGKSEEFKDVLDLLVDSIEDTTTEILRLDCENRRVKDNNRRHRRRLRKIHMFTSSDQWIWTFI